MKISEDGIENFNYLNTPKKDQESSNETNSLYSEDSMVKKLKGEDS